MTETPDPNRRIDDPIARAARHADRPKPSHREGDEQARLQEFLVEAARLLSDLQCGDVLIFDVRDMSQVTDYIIIATGTSDRQMKSAGSHVAELAQQYDLQRFGTERDDASRWIVLDFVEVMIHLFEPEARAHYDLEMMWGDAPQLPWKRS